MNMSIVCTQGGCAVLQCVVVPAAAGREASDGGVASVSKVTPQWTGRSVDSTRPHVVRLVRYPCCVSSSAPRVPDSDVAVRFSQNGPAPPLCWSASTARTCWLHVDMDAELDVGARVGVAFCGSGAREDMMRRGDLDSARPDAALTGRAQSASTLISSQGSLRHHSPRPVGAGPFHGRTSRILSTSGLTPGGAAALAFLLILLAAVCIGVAYGVWRRRQTTAASETVLQSIKAVSLCRSVADPRRSSRRSSSSSDPSVTNHSVSPHSGEEKEGRSPSRHKRGHRSSRQHHRRPEDAPHTDNELTAGKVAKGVWACVKGIATVTAWVCMRVYELARWVARGVNDAYVTQCWSRPEPVDPRLARRHHSDHSVSFDSPTPRVLSRVSRRHSSRRLTLPSAESRDRQRSHKSAVFGYLVVPPVVPTYDATSVGALVEAPQPVYVPYPVQAGVDYTPAPPVAFSSYSQPPVLALTDQNPSYAAYTYAYEMPVSVRAPGTYTTPHWTTSTASHVGEGTPYDAGVYAIPVVADSTTYSRTDTRRLQRSGSRQGRSRTMHTPRTSSARMPSDLYPRMHV